ncbi:MAG TPA: DUF2382 domain-containing protein [Ktedonobacterales bacterium]|nr:DUF2382 domain-containing protein [Ktedonobacterales bacterium]
MDSYSEAPDDLVVHGEVITPGAWVEAEDGPVGRVERIMGAHRERHGATTTGSLLVRALDGHELDISADVVRRVIPNQPAPTVYLGVSRSFLGLAPVDDIATPFGPPVSTPAAEPTPTGLPNPNAVPADSPSEARDMTGRERATSEEVVVPRSEERLSASTEWRERGQAHIHKRVVFENQRLVVPLNYEEVVVEHLSPEHFEADAPLAEDEMIIPVMEERLVVRKETVVREYLRVRKQSTVKQYQVRGQVRREIVQVDETPNPLFADQAAPLVHETAPDATDAPSEPAS